MGNIAEVCAMLKSDVCLFVCLLLCSCIRAVQIDEVRSLENRLFGPKDPECVKIFVQQKANEDPVIWRWMEWTKEDEPGWRQAAMQVCNSVCAYQTDSPKYKGTWCFPQASRTGTNNKCCKVSYNANKELNQIVI